MSKTNNQLDEVYLLGKHVECYVGYATSFEDRDNAASGGVVTAITRYLLEKGLVDGVLSSKLVVEEGELVPKSVIARSVSELEGCKNSIYLDFNPGGGGRYRAILEELEQSDATFAVVGLYCHLRNLTTSMERRGIERSRVLMIGLFCSHAPEPILAKKVLERQGADLSKAVAYHTKTGEGLRDGRLYGRSRLDYADGTHLDFPFIEFTTFKNSWFYTPKKCLSCPDQFAEVADISCGDAWYPEIRKHPYKQTTIVARTQASRRLMLAMVRERELELRYVDPKSIVNSQKRVAGVEKMSAPARVKVASYFGIKLPPQEGPKRIRDYAHSLFMLGAVKAATSESTMRFIMKLPTFLVLGYTLTIKVLEQFLIPTLKDETGPGGVVTGYEDRGDDLIATDSIR